MRRVEEDLLNISAGGPAETVDILIFSVFSVYVIYLFLCTSFLIFIIIEFLS